MKDDAPKYEVIDRSILLPYYKRFLIEPFLPLLPRSLNPNWITHFGHLLNLLGVALLFALWPERGWPLAVAALLLHAYTWCDNADGAHARRTGQCSTAGEYLDHGLDLLNTVYIAYFGAFIMDVDPVWWVVLVVLVPGAAAVTYWEQAKTGMFRLGMLNQLESVMLVSLVMLVAAITSTSFLAGITIFGVSLRLMILTWVPLQILFGMGQNMVRVAQVHGVMAAAPVLVFLLFGCLLTASVALGAVHVVAGVTIASAVTVYFGMNMLWARLGRHQPRVERLMVLSVVVLGFVVCWAAFGSPASSTSVVLGAVAFVVYGGRTLLDARHGIQRLDELAESPRVA